MKLLCVGDLQLHELSPMHSLEEQIALWTRAVEIAHEREVDALLVLGDVTHRYPATPAEYLAFWRPIRKYERELRVIAIPGNHDSGGAARPTTLDVLNGPGIEVLDRPGWRKVGDGSVAVLPWVPVSRLAAEAGGGSRDGLNIEAAELLLHAARGLRNDIKKAKVSGPAVLGAHWTVSGAVFADGSAIETHMREPVLSAGELVRLGFDAIALAHIHERQMLNDEPPMFYVGSPWAGDWSEVGPSHGVTLLTVSASGECEMEHIEIADKPFLNLDFRENPAGASALTVIQAHAFDEVEDGTVVQLRYAATAEEARRIDQSAIERKLIAAGASKVIFKPQIERQERARVAEIAEDSGPAEQLELWIASQEIDPDIADELRALIHEYLNEMEAVA